MTSPLPSLSLLPFYGLAGGLLGYTYGKITQVDPIIAAKVLGISMIADTCLYKGVDYFLGDNKGKKSHLIYGLTNCISMGAAIKVFNDLEFLGTTGTIVTSSIVMLHLVGQYNIFASS
ncbi:MAG: hypothetical protein H0V82_06950 [Candidatus Protochlamydia sp.]|nr:hypothetical protein [Candidatus Protochlamydia sp.]